MMAKCDVCGAQYDDALTACPVCGEEAAPQTASDEVQLSFSFQEPAPKKKSKKNITLSIVIAFAVIAAIVVSLFMIFGGNGEEEAPSAPVTAPATAQTIVGRWQVSVKLIPFLEKAVELADEYEDYGPTTEAADDDAAADRASLTSYIKPVLTVLKMQPEYFKDMTVSFYVEMDADGKCRLTMTPEELDAVFEELLSRVQRYVADDNLDHLMAMSGMSVEQIESIVRDTTARFGYELDVSYEDFKVLIAEDALQDIADVFVQVIKVVAMAEDIYVDGKFRTPDIRYSCEDGKVYFASSADGEVNKDRYLTVQLVDNNTAQLDTSTMFENEEDKAAAKALFETVTVTRQIVTTPTTDVTTTAPAA